jgi:hypothetical protein
VSNFSPATLAAALAAAALHLRSLGCLSRFLRIRTAAFTLKLKMAANALNGDVSR